MSELAKKKILILGGSRISVEIVKAAKKKGLYTIVTDWYDLDQSPAKQIADKFYQVSTSDMDALMTLIQDEGVEGIITGFTDSVLPHYADICEIAGLPCYGRRDLFELFTNKKSYKKKLREFAIPVIDDYQISFEDVLNQSDLSVKYPLLVKPSDGSGSLGVSICRNYEQLLQGYAKAKEISKTKSVLVERFVEGEEATIFFLFDKGTVYLSGVSNRHIKKNQGSDVLALPVAYTFPSYITPMYVKDIYPKMLEMFSDVGIKDGMMFAQCLIEDDECYIYDIGYRLTGSLEYKIQEQIHGYNPLDMMIDFAMTGDMFFNTSQNVTIDPFWHEYGFNISILAETQKEINVIKGIEEALKYDGVSDIVRAHIEGEILPESAKGALKQIAIRVLGSAPSIQNLKKALQDLYEHIDLLDKNGDSMKLEGLDIDDIDERVLSIE